MITANIVKMCLKQQNFHFVLILAVGFPLPCVVKILIGLMPVGVKNLICCFWLITAKQGNVNIGTSGLHAINHSI